MENKKFRQNLEAEDLIAFNYYLVDRKAKSSIFPRLIGLFIFILGCMDIAKENASIPMCLVTMAIGVFGMLGLVPLSTYMQKKSIRKKLTQANSIVPMDVTVYEEGIRFELPQTDNYEETQEEISVEKADEELSDNELRELEYANDEVVEEAEEPQEQIEEVEAEVVEEETEEVQEPTIAKVEGEREFRSQPKPEENPTNAFTIPWGGMSNVEETNDYLFVNVAGYQTMIIRKDQCDSIDEVIAYIKENLRDHKRYITNIKKVKADNE